MNDALLEGYLTGYMEKTAGLTDKLEDIWNNLSEKERIALVTGAGGLAGAGIGGAVAGTPGALIGGGTAAALSGLGYGNRDAIASLFKGADKEKSSAKQLKNPNVLGKVVNDVVLKQSPVETKARQAMDKVLTTFKKNEKSLNPILGSVVGVPSGDVHIGQGMDELRTNKNNALSHVDKVRGDLGNMAENINEYNDASRKAAQALLPKKYTFKDVVDKLTSFNARKHAKDITTAQLKGGIDLQQALKDATDKYLFDRKALPTNEGANARVLKYLEEDTARRMNPALSRIEDIQRSVKANRPGLKNTYDSLKDIFNNFKK